MKSFILGIAVACGLSACALNQVASDQVTTVLTELTNKQILDLQTARSLALAATPPDGDGSQCFGSLPDPSKPGDTGTGALAVAAALQRLVAAQKGAVVGAISTAEFASIVQPGSEQFNWAVKTLETACIAKVHDVNQAINSTAGIFTALPAILGLAALPAGA